MRPRDYVFWTDVINTTSTGSYTYSVNTAYSACPPTTTTATVNTAYSGPPTTYIDCADYCIKWFREEENEDTEEWEHLLEEGEK